MIDCVGKITNIYQDFSTGTFKATLEIDEDIVATINSLSNSIGQKLRIKFSKYSEKRSIDANALLWVCIGKIANELRCDKWEVYLRMLRRYGKYTYICVKPEVVDAVKEQWRECEEIGTVEINGKDAVQMLCYFGSSTYNAKEFSILLDGVISEMKEMGIDAPTSKEMQRSLEAWQNKGL